MSHPTSNNSEPKIFIIKKVIKKKAHGHHGGAWKIAYADFVTAMMAFFLLMWLLSLMNKYQLMGISEYFNRPMKEAHTSQSEKEKNLREGGKDRYLMSEKPSGPAQYHGADKIARVVKSHEVNKPATGLTETSKTSNPTKVDKEYIKNLHEKMVKDLNKDPEMQQYKNMLNFIVTADGLKIQMHDLENKPMFSQGETDFGKYSQKILGWLADELNGYPKRVAIIGHTDSANYRTPNYSNWELSADRASATRRALIKNGMNPQQIMRIIGMGDSQLLDKKNGLNPSNRRIEIIVLTDEASKKLLH